VETVREPSRSDPDHYIQPRNPCSDSQLESHGGDQHGCGLYGQFTNYDRRCASTILPRHLQRRGRDVTPDNFARIMKSTVKLSNSQSLFVTPSLVTGLYTSTKTKSSAGGGPQRR